MAYERSDEAADELPRTDEEWRARLTPEQFAVTRRGGTEPAFGGEYWDTKEPGIYHCVGCGTPLFSSEAKYDSGTGWPSFFQPIDEEDLVLETDRSLGMVRTEVSCRRCGAHLGHVFPDGPQPTGERYCMNSVAMRLESGEQPG